MAKQILIISSTPRKGGNSEVLCAHFARGAQEAGHRVDTVLLREKNIGFCTGCYACSRAEHCVQKDDALARCGGDDQNLFCHCCPSLEILFCG